MTQLVSALDRFMRAAAILLVLALLGCVVTGVISRQLNRPVTWSDEMAQYLLVWTGFVGWTMASRRRSHIRITVFVDLLPGISRQIAEIATQVAVILFAVALVVYGTPLIGRNWDVSWVSLPLPAGLLYVPIPFAAAVLIGQALVEIVLAFQGRYAHVTERSATL